MVKVKDIYLNAYLKAKGFSPEKVDIEDLDGRRTVFWLYEDAAEAVVIEYRESELMRDFVREYLYSKREIIKILGL